MPGTTLRFLHTGNPTGLKFLLEYGDARCLFDFGQEHSPGRTPFSLGLEPRAGRELADLLAVGAAPAIPGVYAGEPWDQRTHLFISHLHLDHSGLIPHLGPDVPLFYPAAVEDLRRAASDCGYLRWREPGGKAVGDGEVVSVGPIQVRFLAVDHDLPGASGFLVETPDAAIAFTGDLRLHGLHPEVTEAFMTAVKGVDVLIQEGVTLGMPPLDPAQPPLTEAGVIAGLGRAVAESPGLVIVNCYGMNRERVAGLAEGCAAAGRTLLMEPQMAALAGWEGVIGDLEPARREPGAHCLQLGFESLPLLIDLRPPPGSVYIPSGGAPFGSFDPRQAVADAWVERFGLANRPLNSSGHSRPADVARIVSGIRPRVVLPVHSRAPEALSVPGVESFVPQAGPTYRVADILARPQPRTPIPDPTRIVRRRTRRR
ncbi:MAG TPA: MBL fold metallo-hydrolase [Candidatus Dormibacteraeota bacterium]|nr:MBL fold metallo-hydrolase [Candidatus Dormibacteraeota bacterium]